MTSTDYSQSARGRASDRAASAIVALILLTFGLLRIFGWLVRIDAPALWDYGPGEMAVAVHLFRNGARLYRDFVVQPSTPTVYAPVVPLMTALITPLFGTGLAAALAAGRSIAVLSTLAVCMMIFALARRFSASKAASLIVALSFLASPLLEPWGFEFRVDLPALALGLSALLAFQEGYGFFAVFLCVVSFFCKQVSVAAIAAIVLFSWFEGERRQAAVLALVWLGAVIALTVLFQWIWPFYLFNTFTAVSADYFDPWAALTFPMLTFFLDIGIGTLAVAAIVNQAANRLAIIFLGAAILQDAASATHWGSGVYYFLPTVAAMALVGVAQLDRILSKLGRLPAPARFFWATLGGFVLLWGNLILPHFGLSNCSLRQLASARCRSAYPWNEAALRTLHSIRGPVITDDVGLMLIDGSAQLRPINLMVLGEMKSKGIFDDTKFLDAIRCRRIAAFALDRTKLARDYRGRKFFWPALRQAIEANYAFAPSPGPPFLMLPKSGPACSEGQSGGTEGASPPG